MTHMLAKAMLTMMAVSILGCGGSDSLRPEADATDAQAALVGDFVGTWNASGSASTKWELPEGPVSNTEPSSMRIQVQEGASSDLVILIDHCALPAKVSGKVAVLQAGYTCTAVVEGGSATFVVEAGNATLTDGVLSFTSSGTFSVTSQGQTFPGTWTWQYSMTKLSK